MNPPNQNRLSWDDYFMSIAIITAQRSPDPSTQVGSVLVGPDKKIKGTGYNGTPERIDWTREGEDNKYLYVAHSELNCIINTPSRDLKNSILYTTLHPCADCAKAIIQAGIKKVWYLENKYSDTPIVKAAAKMFDMSHIECKQFHFSPEITLHYQKLGDIIKMTSKG